MDDGYLIVPNVLNEIVREQALDLIAELAPSHPSVMASSELFAIRNVCGIIPGLLPLVWTKTLRKLVSRYGSDRSFLTRSIYFDKPSGSNWFVAYHQDISISVEQRGEVDGFTGWTSKRGMVGVIPRVHVLERTLTVRIHFDDTDASNGALRVCPKSHLKGIYRGAVDASEEVICPVQAGGAMLMRPLLLHASDRSLTGKPRRVLHLEFNDQELPEPLRWAERMALPSSP
jgi:hypothetical protein